MRRLSLLLIALWLSIPNFAQQQLPPVDPNLTTGDIALAGSPALFKMTENLIRRFQLSGYLGNASLNSTDSNSAIQAFCSGQLDIALADRPMSPQEINTCSSAGRAPVVFRVATISVTVVAASSNTFLDNITSAELQQIFSTVLTWNGIRPDFPTEPIQRIMPPVGSVTFNLFASSVFGDTRPLETAVNAQFLEDQQAALSALNANPFAIAFFDSDFMVRNASSAKLLSINNSEPSFENIARGTYALSRPMLLYTSASVVQAKPQVADFLNFYLSNSQNEASLVGLFPVPTNTQQIAVNTWFSIVPQANNTPEAPAPQSTEAVIDSITPAPTQVATEAPPTTAFNADAETVLTNARNDLEMLANQLFGTERPAGYSGSADMTNPQMPLLLRLDLEIIAASQYGADSRPETWFGVVSSTTLSIARDVRHDLELLADKVFGEIRPDLWLGDNPVFRCGRATQALAQVLEQSSDFTVAIPANSPTYCRDVEITASQYAEVNYIGQIGVNLGQGGGGDSAVEIESQFAVAFYNSNASTRAGVVPVSEPLTAVARSYLGFSRMTLFQGGEFLLFLDYRDTTLSPEVYETLPDMAAIEDLQTYCEAFWCE